MPLRVIITDGPAADCTQTKALIKGMSVQHLLAEEGCYADAIVANAIGQKLCPVMPPKSNRIVQREYDKHLYKSRRTGMCSSGSKGAEASLSATPGKPLDYSPS